MRWRRSERPAMGVQGRVESAAGGFADWFTALLARVGVVDREMGREAFGLAAPVMVTGAFRVLLRLSDFLMVGLATGDVGIAAVELGFQYYFIPFGLSLALTSGTISVVSRYTGADRPAEADFAVKQSLWLALLVALPVTAVAWFYSPELIGLLTDDRTTVRLGAAYLQIVMLSVAFRFWGMIAARALAGVGDTRTPMYVRLVTLPTNVLLNGLLIFGPGPFPALGVAGAAIGTAIANVLAALVFLALLLSGRHAVTLHLGGKQWDWSMVAELVRVSAPLAGTRLARTLGRFPFVFVLGTFGPAGIAAYGVGRRVILLAMMPAWGYATAASTLVGQHVGSGDSDRADAYGWQVARIALATQLLIAAVLMVAARPIATAFGTESVALTADFIRVFGLGVAGFSLSRTMRGGLRGAGDTSYPFYGTMAATYALRLPIAFLALPVGTVLTLGPVSLSPGLGLGYAAVFAAILAEIYTKAVVNTLRFRAGTWKRIAQRSGVPTAGD